MPFKLLFLDLPRRPAAFIAASGLSAPGARGYVAVDPHTLQHTQYPNIFAVGDCAALPTARSYGAVFSQVPVAAHNVVEFLQHRTPNAAYDGFASTPLVMTPWRAMWPQRRYDPAVVPPPSPSASLQIGGGKAAAAGGSSPQRYDDRDTHYWDSSAWRDLRGFMNGVAVQLFGYESLHWFVALRGQWYPPHGFSTPLYTHGSPLVAESPSHATSTSPAASGAGQ